MRLSRDLARVQVRESRGLTENSVLADFRTHPLTPKLATSRIGKVICNTVQGNVRVKIRVRFRSKNFVENVFSDFIEDCSEHDFVKFLS